MPICKQTSSKGKKSIFAKTICMSTIRLKNIRIFANHGCLTEEEKIGSDYIVNLEVTANLSKAAKTDELSDTVDYVQLQKIVREQMAIRSKLLEQVGQRIIDGILKDIQLVDAVKVRVSKINPPIGGDIAEVSVTMTSER